MIRLLGIAFMKAIAEGISSGEMTKVVSSREVEFTSDTPYKCG